MMKRTRILQILAFFLPGLAVAVGAILWGFFLVAPTYEIADWKGVWSEPKQPPGWFKSFREQGDVIVAETEGWPHKHPRANSYLLSDQSFAGNIDVTVTAKFVRGRYLGVYLCYDPVSENGYWLSTGHAVGEFPDQAYIKIVRDGEWKTMARATLEIVPGKQVQITYRRQGKQLEILVDGRSIVQWNDSSFDHGRVQLRLHNTKLELVNLAVSGDTSAP